MAHPDLRVMVFDGEYSAALVVSSMLDAAGIGASVASFDERARVYVAAGDEAEARRLLEPGEPLAE